MARREEKHFGAVWPATLLAVIGLAVFANGLSAPFIYDDYESIVWNPNILHLQPLRDALSAPADTPGAGRPLVSLSFAINHALGGFSPRGYRIWNLAVHLLNALLLFGIVRRTLEARAFRAQFGSLATPFAFASALIWLIHPLQTEVVDYVTQRTESMMAFFYLLALYCARRAMDGGSKLRYWTALSVGACACGMACKESMVTAPVMILLYDAAFESGSVWKALRTRWPLHAGLAATWSILIALLAAAPRGNSAGLSSEITPWMYFLNQPEVILKYLSLVLWPRGLILDYGLPRAVPLGEVVPAAAALVVLLSAAVMAWRLWPPIGFLGIWFFVTLSPTSSFVPIATEVGAERRMYLPLAAVVLLALFAATAVAYGVERARARRRTQWLRRVAVAGFVGICGFLSASSVQRNRETLDPVGLWQTVLDRRPHGRAHYGLGSELRMRGRSAEAIQHFLAATSESPKAYYALGVVAEQEGRHLDAVKNLREYVRLRPFEVEVIDSYNLIGKALTAEGKLEEAAAAFQQALAMRPGNADARDGLSVVHTRLGLSLVAQDRESEAAEQFARAVAFKPDDPSKRENLGHALAAAGRLEEATVQYREALRLLPGKATLSSALGAVLLAQGKNEEAVQHLQHALELAPNDDRVRMDVAAAFRRLGVPR